MAPTRPRHAPLAGIALLLAATAAGLATTQGTPPSGGSEKSAPSAAVAPKERLLVFSKTAGFRHQSIPDGIKALKQLLGDRYEVDATEDSAAFTVENLARYRAIVFLSTTGDVLNDDQQKALESFIHAGGGYAGVHAAADTEHTWPWYGELVGAYFKTHPPVQPALVRVEDRSHRSTRMLPAEWRRSDEWYVYEKSPRGSVTVLANLDDSTIKGPTMDGDHPIAWYHEFQGGRAWYTGGGHTSESFTEELFLKHLEGGILWAAGAAEKAPGAEKPAADPRR